MCTDIHSPWGIVQNTVTFNRHEVREFNSNPSLVLINLWKLISNQKFFRWANITSPKPPCWKQRQTCCTQTTHRGEWLFLSLKNNHVSPKSEQQSLYIINHVTKCCMNGPAGAARWTMSRPLWVWKVVRLVFTEEERVPSFFFSFVMCFINRAAMLPPPPPDKVFLSSSDWASIRLSH